MQRTSLRHLVPYQCVGYVAMGVWSKAMNHEVYSNFACEQLGLRRALYMMATELRPSKYFLAHEYITPLNLGLVLKTIINPPQKRSKVSYSASYK